MALIPSQHLAALAFGAGSFLCVVSSSAGQIVIPIEGDGSFFATQGANVPFGHFHGTITYTDTRGIPNAAGGFMAVLLGTVDGYGFQFSNDGGFFEIFDFQVDPVTGEFRSFYGSTIANGSRSDFHPVGYEYQNHFSFEFDSTGHGFFDWTATYVDSPSDRLTGSASASGRFGPVPDAGNTALLLGISALSCCFIRRLPSAA